MTTLEQLAEIARLLEEVEAGAERTVEKLDVLFNYDLPAKPPKT